MTESRSHEAIDMVDQEIDAVHPSPVSKLAEREEEWHATVDAAILVGVLRQPSDVLLDRSS